MGGRDLDRFSRYAFGTFDNRLHGYPAALIRYDRGAVMRTAVAWSLGRVMRLDGFADTRARARSRFWARLRHYHRPGRRARGAGAVPDALAARVGLRAPGDRHRRPAGTHVVRLSGYKVF